MLAPAIPVIASNFNAFGQLGWISGAFYMTQCGSMLLFGQCSELFDTKYVLIVAILFNMLGSAISGGASDVTSLIVGRAVAGIGSAGCYMTVQALVAYLVDLKYRALIFGLFGLQNVIAVTAGPISAGAFSDSGLWRMCFLIVLPLGTVAIILNLIVMPSVPPLPLTEEMEQRLQKQISRFPSCTQFFKERDWAKRVLLADWLGFILATGSLVCFVLAMQWGGSEYAWSSSHVIGVFVGFVAIGAAFFFVQSVVAWPLIPLRVLRNRTVVGSCVMALSSFMCNLFAATFLSVIYEAGYGYSSLRAGLHVIPYFAIIIGAQLAEGAVLAWTKRYWYWGWTSPMIIAVGGGLLYTIKSSTSTARLIGYQVIYGLGIGLTQGVPIVAVQADSKERDVAQALATLAFTQLFGGTCGPVIGSAVLDEHLKANLKERDVPANTIAEVISSVNIIKTLQPVALRESIIEAYLLALNQVFIIAVPLAGIVCIAGLCIRNKVLRKDGEGAH